MSNVGQAALVIVGTVVGAYFGAPQLGFVLGSLAGNALFPTQLPGQSGPRLSDNQTTTSVVGSPVPILFGTASLSGTFMWLDKIVEKTNTQNVGGKGGPTQTNTTYSYTQSVAVGLCEGPISGISRIWENGTLVYDIRPQMVGETDTNYANRLTVAAVYAETFTLHLGGEDQMPDATIESVLGMGNVPGFRGLAYIVYPERKLQESQALRHPSFRFEAYESGGGNCVTSAELSNDVLFDWEFNDGRGNPMNPLNLHKFRILSIDPAAPGSPLDASVVYTSLNDALGVVSAAHGFPVDTFLTYGIGPADDGENIVHLTAAVNGAGQSATDLRSVQLHFGTTIPTFIDPISGLGPFFAPSGADGPPTAIWWQGSEVLEKMSLTVDGTGHVPPPPLPGFLTSVGGPVYWYSVLKDTIIRAYRTASPPADPCHGLPPAPIAGYCIRSDGKFIRGGTWTLDTVNSYKVLQQFFGTSVIGNSTRDPLNPCVLTGSADDNSTFWTAAYNAAVTAGKIASGFTYGIEYPIQQNRAWTLDLQVCDGAGAQVSIGHIIRVITARCGLTGVDASDMDSVFVDGYAVSSMSSGRDILTPLRSVGFFDCVESGETLKFVARGKAIVASLEADDFGAFDSGANAVPGPSITTVKAQDADLPLQTRVHYFATSREYEAGEQLSPTRITTTAVNVVDVELAVCISDTQAAKIADVLWSDAWAERWGGTLAVDQSQSRLEPGDCIEVPVDGVTRRIRIVNETVASGVLRTLNYVRDDDGAYVSHAVASPPQRQPQVLTLLSPTDLELLDLPALLDTDNDAGVYAAARPSTVSGNAWGGCVIFRSADGGATFAQLGSISSPTTMGTIHAAVTPSDWHTWDDVTTITVDVAAGVTFESRSDAAVLTGANTAAMGFNGRWEIVQFANATQLSSTQWRLSRLLRGRRGTENNISSSVLGDRFIMISTGTLVRLPLQTSEIGANRIYKSVTIGAPFSSGIDQTFSGQGVALRPFSPVFLTAARSSDDIVFNWTRRGRLGRTLMSGTDIPLSEATESYSVDIYTPDAPHTVVRTLTASVPHVTYTAAQQSTDFGSDSATHIMAAVYQVSAIVGRGTPDVQILTIS